MVPSREIVQLMSNMLSQRLFRVYLGSTVSDFRKLNNGLPQGSVLAPMLFNLYIHDLPTTGSRKFIYAVDICLIIQAKLFSDMEV